MPSKNPYDPSPNPDDQPRSGPSAVVVSNLSAYTPTEGVARILSVILTVFALALLASAITAWFGDPARLGSDVVSLAGFKQIDGGHRIVALSLLVESLILVICFLVAGGFLSVWTYRVVNNAGALGSIGLKYGPLWASVSWWIPFINLVIPYLVLQEVYRSSHPDEDPDSWRTAPDTIMLPLWWLLWVGAGNVSAFGAKIVALSTGDQSELSVAVRAIDSAGDALITVSTILAILVINAITRQQERKRLVLARGELPAPAPEWRNRYVPSNVPVITFTVIVALLAPSATTTISIVNGLMQSINNKTADAKPASEEDDAWKDIREERYDDALAKFDQLIEDNPDQARYHYGRGLAYEYKEQYDDALYDFEQSVKLDKSDGEAYRERGYVRYRRREYGKAITDLQKAVLLLPDNFLANYYLGLAYQGAKKYDPAIAQLSKAANLDPKYGDAFYNRAQCYFKQKKYDQALKDYKRASELSLDDPDAFYGAGICLAYQKKYKDARSCYKKARALYLVKNNEEWVKEVDNSMSQLPK